MPRRAKQADQDRLDETFQYEVEGARPPHEGEAMTYMLLHEGDSVTPLPQTIVVVTLRLHMNKVLPITDVLSLHARALDIGADFAQQLAGSLYSFAPDGDSEWEVSYTQE